MSPAMPLLHDEVFLEEHRRIRLRLVRLSRFSSVDSGFPTLLGSLVACMDEIEGLLPELTEHFTHEERLFYADYDPNSPGEEHHRGEQILAEHQPLLRELRALLESGRRVTADLRDGLEVGPMAEALKVYLSACVLDLLDHEDKENQLFAQP